MSNNPDRPFRILSNKTISRVPKCSLYHTGANALFSQESLWAVILARLALETKEGKNISHDLCSSYQIWILPLLYPLYIVWQQLSWSYPAQCQCISTFARDLFHYSERALLHGAKEKCFSNLFYARFYRAECKR